jgi:hypothetical protein
VSGGRGGSWWRGSILNDNFGEPLDFAVVNGEQMGGFVPTEGVKFLTGLGVTRLNRRSHSD